MIRKHDRNITKRKGQINFVDAILIVVWIMLGIIIGMSYQKTLC